MLLQPGNDIRGVRIEGKTSEKTRAIRSSLMSNTRCLTSVIPEVENFWIARRSRGRMDSRHPPGSAFPLALLVGVPLRAGPHPGADIIPQRLALPRAAFHQQAGEVRISGRRQRGTLLDRLVLIIDEP